MPGRQAHGRPLLATSASSKSSKKTKSKARANALDAFGIASKQFPTKEKRTPRYRELEADVSQKHQRADDGDDDGEHGESEPRRKRIKASGADSDVEYGSDSEGNEWQFGVDEDNDSEIDSDEAFGESDEEKFSGYALGGSKGKGKAKVQDSDDEADDDDDDDESLGEDAIDLAQALDEADDESVEEEEGSDQSDQSGSEEDDASSPPSSDEDSEDDEAADPTTMDALKDFITEFGGAGGKDAAADGQPKQRQKIELKDLGLFGVKDAQMKKSLKLMSKEEKEKRPGATKKLEVPLARRQQDKLLRNAAYEKANETLGRWQETVKQNRRADHLIFPLPQDAPDAGLNKSELQPLTAKKSTSELEQTILGIMEQSGLALTKQTGPKTAESGEDQPGTISRSEMRNLQNQKRLERELNSREAKRLKRIKKIKSKAYHRVHRKQREREELAMREAIELEGGINSEEERDAQDRRRALERVGARHRDSKWAKSGAATKRAVWDDDFRAGLHDMQRREEELRQRKDGRAAVASDDEDSDEFSGSEDEAGKLRAQLDRLERQEDEPEGSGLMQLKFMQKAEAALKKSNDALIAQIRKDIASEDEDAGSEDDGAEVGRKQFGMATPGITLPTKSKKKTPVESTTNADGTAHFVDASKLNIGSSIDVSDIDPTAGAWSQGEKRRKGKKQQAPVAETLDLGAAVLVAERPSSKSKSKPSTDQAAEADSDSDPDLHLPLAIRDQELVARAFAGDDVVVDFEREKAALAEEQDDKIIDNTLPGWGSWVGEGISKRDKERHKGRFLTKVEGVKKKDRKDARLERVIINEKRVKKNNKYLANQLPHPFESVAQYERSLRLPVGPEWMTKETFQDSTKPRILLKQGIIAPMSKPLG